MPKRTLVHCSYPGCPITTRSIKHTGVEFHRMKKKWAVALQLTADRPMMLVDKLADKLTDKLADKLAGKICSVHFLSHCFKLKDGGNLQQKRRGKQAQQSPQLQLQSWAMPVRAEGHCGERSVELDHAYGKRLEEAADPIESELMEKKMSQQSRKQEKKGEKAQKQQRRLKGQQKALPKLKKQTKKVSKDTSQGSDLSHLNGEANKAIGVGKTDDNANVRNEVKRRRGSSAMKRSTLKKERSSLKRSAGKLMADARARWQRLCAAGGLDKTQTSGLGETKI